MDIFFFSYLFKQAVRHPDIKNQELFHQNIHSAFHFHPPLFTDNLIIFTYFSELLPVFRSISHEKAVTLHSEKRKQV